MWLNEMQALAAVQPHPHIVGMYDAWFDTDTRGDAEQAYIKLELCGESLGDVVKRRVPLREPEVLEILRQMASALRRIHEVGMVHLDVKPDNIYTAAGPAAPSRDREHAVVAAQAAGLSGAIYKLGDFGLAAMPGGQRAGTSEGDAKYLAPEAFKSHNFLSSGFADRLDIFALGASAYELLRGSELPKNGPSYHDIRGGKIFLPSASAQLVLLLKKMMAPDPSQRPTAEQLLRSPLLRPPQPSGSLQPSTSLPLPMSQ
ncbi:hypothetical protein HYH03_007428 [Edaphochlamys debaryana]|uniref:Protein kinase domain-containing protein n=1 Tax=Edaphochlamys debaryana TaxID=47281 RepID=A0A835Y1U0_9CHLO|nr:hypothetical protein HYH03_007428 [Edaphochlamys debaryana]|eukprot:KAG2494371.1 hypothetical protein HYH03_007428 [Edaphochlamys debaryana]